MRQCGAGTLAQVVRMLAQAEAFSLDRQDAQHLVPWIEPLEEGAVLMQLPSLAGARRLIEKIKDEDAETASIEALMQELRRRLEDELNGLSVWQIDADNVPLFRAVQLFGPDVEAAFPDLAFDIAETGKCLALGRSTAAVFHLMRIIECGLRSIAGFVGVTDPKPNWNAALQQIEKKRKGQRGDELRFLDDVLAHMNAIRVAWRNPVMHIDRKYTDEEAREILVPTRALMRLLAYQLGPMSAKA